MARYESDGKTFTLISPGDYLAKIVWECQRLKGTDPTQLPDFLYQTVTCLSDIWHMHEWVYAALGDKDVHPRQGLRKFREQVKAECRDLAICREIADAHKHSRVDISADPNISTGYVLGPGPLRKAPTQWFIVDGDEWRDPKDVAEGGLTYWMQFLGKHGMCSQTPVEDLYRGETSLL